MFASTVTIGSTSAGNSTFLIRLPPAISTLDDSSSDEENQVHGQDAAEQEERVRLRSSARGSGRTTEKTNE